MSIAYNTQPICLNPIGTTHVLTETASVLQIDLRYADGLLGITVGTRLQVLYWMHQLGEDERGILQAHPRGERSRTVQGVFALRSPMRPNPIGVTVVEAVRVNGCQLTVAGLDARDGSPILDLKAEPPSREVAE